MIIYCTHCIANQQGATKRLYQAHMEALYPKREPQQKSNIAQNQMSSQEVKGQFYRNKIQPVIISNNF